MADMPPCSTFQTKWNDEISFAHKIKDKPSLW